MATRVLTGDEDLDALLATLGMTIANRIAKAALRAGVSEVAREIKRLAPKGETGATRKSVKGRVEVKRRGDFVAAKVGVNVGSKRANAVSVHAPHAHLVALGTGPRFRKRIGGKYAMIRKPTQSQLKTGIMPANNFVRQGYDAARGGSLQRRVIEAAKKALEREAIRAAKRNRSNK